MPSTNCHSSSSTSMPLQRGEPAFALDERLFRYVRKDWIDDDGEATEEAVDLLGTSVDRETFARDPEARLTSAPPDIVAVSVIVFGDIPVRFEAPPVKPPAKPPTPYESIVEYCPENGNDAHSEIQFWRVGDTEKSKPKSSALKSEIRGRLVERMRVIHRR